MVTGIMYGKAAKHGPQTDAYKSADSGSWPTVRKLVCEQASHTQATELSYVKEKGQQLYVLFK